MREQKGELRRFERKVDNIYKWNYIQVEYVMGMQFSIYVFILLIIINYIYNFIKKNKTKKSIIIHKIYINKHTLIHEQDDKTEQIPLEATITIRTKDIMDQLFSSGINVSKIDAVTSLGGMLKPVEGGTYFVTDAMIHDLKQNYSGKHISNLGAIIAYDISKELNVAAYVVDPPVVNELHEEARYTGVPTIKRQSIFHALNQRAVARLAANELGKSYNEINVIVCHLGIGITIGVHKCGRVIDVNNGLHGDGPFSIERAGTLPVQDLLELAYSNKHSKENLMDIISFKSGLKAYFNVQNIDEVIYILQNKDPKYDDVIKAMTYQIAKEIGAMATVLKGYVHAIALTGQLATINYITNLIIDRVSWISDIFIYPGEYD